MDTLVFKYPNCPIDSHAQEPLSRLCLDTKCTEKVPLCCICQFEKHQNHNTIPIIHIVKQLRDTSENISPVDGAMNLASIRKHFSQAIANCRRQVLHELSEIQTKAEIYFNSCQQTLFGFYELGQPISAQVQADPRQYRRFFNRLLTLIPTENKKEFVIGDKINSLITSYKERESKMCETLENIESNFKKSIKSIESLFGGHKQYEAKWSETLKGAKIKIADVIAQQSGMESSGQRFCMMDEPLPEGKVVQWGIKVKKFVGWVGVGICLKNIIKTANYHFNYSNIGHGSYLISTNGYTWSHSVKQFNSSNKCFSFNVNDIVYIEYDPIASKLRFKKNATGKDKYQLSIVPPPPGDAYHPCVNLCSTGDSVELVYPGSPIA